MQSAWFKGCKTQEEREDVRKKVANYRTAFEHLKEVIEDHMVKKPSVRDYDTDNWMARQIATNEYNAAIDDLLKLIDLEPRNQRGE